jgi:hypothetical protein
MSEKCPYSYSSSFTEAKASRHLCMDSGYNILPQAIKGGKNGISLGWEGGAKQW